MSILLFCCAICHAADSVFPIINRVGLSVFFRYSVTSVVSPEAVMHIAQPLLFGSV